MTAQFPDRFTSEHPAFKLGEWHAYGLIRGEPSKENYGWGTEEPVPQFVPREVEARCSANWKGYRPSYTLRVDGSLVLERIRYDDDDSTVEIDETLLGDFYLVLKSDFAGPRLYVPFRSGTLVLDREAWKHEGFTGPSPVDWELRTGCHPDYPGPAKLWYELFPDD